MMFIGTRSGKKYFASLCVSFRLYHWPSMLFPCNLTQPFLPVTNTPSTFVRLLGQINQIDPPCRQSLRTLKRTSLRQSTSWFNRLSHRSKKMRSSHFCSRVVMIWFGTLFGKTTPGDSSPSFPLSFTPTSSGFDSQIPFKDALASAIHFQNGCFTEASKLVCSDA